MCMSDSVTGVSSPEKIVLIYFIITGGIVFGTVFLVRFFERRKKSRSQLTSMIHPLIGGMLQVSIEPIYYNEAARLGATIIKGYGMEIHGRLCYPLFQKWIAPKTVILDHFYVVEGARKCYKCRNWTPVIAFALENFYEFSSEKTAYHSNGLQLVQTISPLSSDLLMQLKNTYNYSRSARDVRTRGGYVNRCKCCGGLQGAYYLFEEVDGVFFDPDPSALKFYSVHLPIDFAVEVDRTCYGTPPIDPNCCEIYHGMFTW